MFRIDILPGLIMGFREGLEAFLIIAIMLEYLNKTNRKQDRKYIFEGLGIGIIASLIFGAILFVISKIIDTNSDIIAKLWESIASFIALLLITTLIYFMLKHRNKIVSQINSKIAISISKFSIIALATIMVAREGAEIVLFVFVSVDTYSYLIGTTIGIVSSGVIVFLIYKSLIKVNMKMILNITIIYLILQAGFLLGYSVHEFLSYLSASGALESSNIIYTKLFDLSETFLGHKENLVGILLYATIGWYSKPEIIQFTIQYIYTGFFLYMFFKTRNR